MRWGSFCWWLGLGLAAFLAAFVPAWWRAGIMEERRTRLAAEVEELQRNNQRLAMETRSLRADPYWIEMAARNQWHYARPGERELEEGAGPGLSPALSSMSPPVPSPALNPAPILTLNSMPGPAPAEEP